MKTFRILPALLAVALLAGGCGRYLQASAAVVDGKPISLDQLDRAVDQALAGQEEVAGAQRLETERRVLGQMIQDRIIESEAAAQKIAIDDKIVAERYDAIRSQFASEEEFAEALAAQGVDVASVRDRIRLRLVVEEIQKKLEKDVKISDRQIREAYGDGSAFTEVRARHIFFAVADPSQASAALKKAQAALSRLRGGADFRALAREVSEDPRSKASGGDLGVLRPGATQAGELEQVAFSLKPGQISQPVQSQSGYHIIQVVSKGKKKLAQVTAEIRAQLQQQAAQEAFQKYITDRVRRASVQVNPRFGAFDPAQVAVVDKQFYTPASPPPAEPGGIPDLQLDPNAAPAG